MKNNPLANLYNDYGNYNIANSTPAMMFDGANFNPPTQTETLPYGGGTFNPSGGAGITPAAPVFAGSSVQAASATPATPAETTIDLYKKYRDPKTGDIMTPQEYAISLGDKLPKGAGQIPNYAGDAMTNPDQSVNQLMGRATNLNNARNDIATGTTDPYKVGNQSGIAYSPSELKAIESAYAGIYDPALNDVFSRLRDKKAAEDKLANREEIVFRTNESIRQWKATTGTKSSGDGSGSDYFSDNMLNEGAINAHMDIELFRQIEDGNLKNFFVNPPNDIDKVTDKAYPMNVVFDNIIRLVVEGEMTSTEALEEINGMNTYPSVKNFYIEQVPEVEDEEKESFLKKIWNRLPFVD